jgi:hypothetical protein
MIEEKDVDRAPVDAVVSDREAFWLWVMRRNAAEPILKFERSLKVGKLTVRFSWRSTKNIWGRFGGGWNWKAGFSAGGSTVYFHLLIADLMVSYR